MPKSIEIRNEQLTACISEQGAELQSLVLLKSGEEYLWQGDPQVWSGRAPILFPLVGMLRDNQLEYQGKTSSIPKHGLARQSHFDCIDRQPDSATFRLRSSERTLESFPWQFELQCKFSLEARCLQIAYRVFNRDASEMIFTIGSHPAFALPLDACSLSDYAIEFEQLETLDRFYLNDDGLLEDTGKPLLDNENRIELNDDIFADDALIFKNLKSRSIDLVKRNIGRRLSVDTGGAPHLGLWAKPGAAFVCIEPWHGYNSSVSDSTDFADKPSMLRLAPGAEFNTSIAIDIAA